MINYKFINLFLLILMIFYIDVSYNNWRKHYLITFQEILEIKFSMFFIWIDQHGGIFLATVNNFNSSNEMDPIQFIVRNNIKSDSVLMHFYLLTGVNVRVLQVI